MKRILCLSLLLLSTLSAIGQTSYSVNPTQCGVVADQPMYCAMTLSPANPLGVYPSLQLTDDLVGDTGGILQWANTAGLSSECGNPPCMLGHGVIQADGKGGYRSYPIYAQFCSNGACITEVSTLTVYFEGGYAPASDGGQYTGFLTSRYSYVRQAQIGGGYKWIRSVTSGAVTIN